MGPERKLSIKLRKILKDSDFIAIKLESGRFGTAGWPDWMLLLDGQVVFVELKAPGRAPTKLQAERHRQLEAQGFVTHVISHPVNLEYLVNNMQALSSAKRSQQLYSAQKVRK